MVRFSAALRSVVGNHTRVSPRGFGVLQKTFIVPPRTTDLREFIAAATAEWNLGRRLGRSEGRPFAHTRKPQIVCCHERLDGCLLNSSA